MTHIETARESEHKREGMWEKDRKAVSPNKNTPASTEDMTGTTIGTRDDQHEMSDDFGVDTSRPETPLNPASFAAEDQSEGRTHSRGVTDEAVGAVPDRTIKSSKATLGRHVASTSDGMKQSMARSKHVKSKRAESEKVFSN